MEENLKVDAPSANTKTTHAVANKHKVNKTTLYIFLWVQLPSAANNPDNNNNSSRTISGLG